MGKKKKRPSSQESATRVAEAVHEEVLTHESLPDEAMEEKGEGKGGEGKGKRKQSKKKGKGKGKEAAAASSSSSSSSASVPSSSAAKSDRSDKLALHKAIWRDDIGEVAALLEDPAQAANLQLQDHRGNTPLHIAAHFANAKLVSLLLEKGANPEALSRPGWKPIDEAIATGSMEVATMLMKAGHVRYRQDMLGNQDKWHTKLRELPDFTMELHWDFKLLGGWVPSGLVHQYVPNDVYRMWKRGDAIRVDYSLVGFKNLSIQRGKMTMLFSGTSQGEKGGRLYAINHDKRTIQDFCALPGSRYSGDVEDALKYLFAHDLCSYLPLGSDSSSGSVSGVEFVPAHGWLSSAQKTESVHGLQSKVFHTKGACLRSLYRSDPHAKQTRIPRSIQSDSAFEEYRNKKFDEYFDESDESEFTSGLTWRSENIRKQVKKFEGNVWMTEDFPLTLAQFVSLVEIYSPTNAQWRRLHEYLSMSLPGGYPVRVQVPVWWGVTANVETRNFKHESAPEEMFIVPDSYETISEAYFGQETREMFKTAKSDKADKAEKEDDEQIQ